MAESWFRRPCEDENQEGERRTDMKLGGGGGRSGVGHIEAVCSRPFFSGDAITVQGYGDYSPMFLNQYIFTTTC